MMRAYYRYGLDLEHVENMTFLRIDEFLNNPALLGTDRKVFFVWSPDRLSSLTTLISRDVDFAPVEALGNGDREVLTTAVLEPLRQISYRRRGERLQINTRGRWLTLARGPRLFINFVDTETGRSKGRWRTEARTRSLVGDIRNAFQEIATGDWLSVLAVDLTEKELRELLDQLQKQGVELRENPTGSEAFVVAFRAGASAQQTLQTGVLGSERLSMKVAPAPRDP